MKRKNGFFISVSFILPFILVILFGGVLISIIIGFILDDFSPELLRVSIVNSVVFACGVTMNMLILMFLLKNTGLKTAVFISFSVSSGLIIFDLLYLLVSEPLFFYAYKNVVSLYLIINFVFVITISIVMTIFICMNKMLNDKENEFQKEKMLRTQTELSLLTSKLNPHFLFNALNTVAALLDDKSRAEKVLLDLSALLRENLSINDKSLRPVDDELKYTEKYLSIQKVRFENRLDYSITGDSKYQIPVLIIQTLVENSVKHNADLDVLFVSVNVEESGGLLKISVSDSAKRLKPEMIGQGMGLANCRDRINLTGGRMEILDGGVEIEYKI